MTDTPSFEITVPSDITLGETLIVGVADIGVSGLTAVDYLTTHTEATQVGHVRTENLPDISPFSEGRPRYPLRLYRMADSPLSVFISEVFLPVWAADSLVDELFEWLPETEIEEIAVLLGAPFPHGEREHTVFHVATDPFRERHLEETEISPLSGGFFDGVVGELVTRGLDPDAPSVGVLITPAHYPGPDLEGALRLLDSLETIYDIDVDEAELRDRADEMKQYYQELTARMQSLRENEPPLGSRDYPEDRMYM